MRQTITIFKCDRCGERVVNGSQLTEVDGEELCFRCLSKGNQNTECEHCKKIFLLSDAIERDYIEGSGEAKSATICPACDDAMRACERCQESCFQYIIEDTRWGLDSHILCPACARDRAEDLKSNLRELEESIDNLDWHDCDN